MCEREGPSESPWSFCGLSPSGSEELMNENSRRFPRIHYKQVGGADASDMQQKQKTIL